MRFVYLSRRANRAGYFALKHLLEESGLAPACVFLPLTRDKSGRVPNGQEATAADLIPSHAYNRHRFTGSIAELARHHSVPVVLTADINEPDAMEVFRSCDPELVVIGGGWPQLLKPHVLSHAPFGAINAHPSLLPEFRGTDIHRWQVLDGVRTSGTSVHYVENTFDTGGILAQAQFPVGPTDTPQALAERAAKATGPLLVEAITKIMSAGPGEEVGRPQGRPVGQKYFSRWPWKDLDFLRISWADDATGIARLVLASNQESYYYNGPYACHDGQPYIIRQARLQPHPSTGRRVPGRVLELTDQGPLIECGSDALLLTEVQPASRTFWPGGFHTAPALSGREFGKLLESTRGMMLA